MKKTTKNIIITLAVLLVLGIAAAALMLTNPQPEAEEESGSSTASESLEKIVDRSITEIGKIDVKNNESGETITLVPTKKDAESEQNDTFTLEGWENEDVIKENALNLALKFYSIQPTKEIGTVENLSEYGLSGDGAFKGTVTYKDGTKDSVVIGSEAGETYGRYILYHDVVYITPASKYLTNTKFDFIAKEIVDIPTPMTVDPNGNEMEEPFVLKSLRLSGGNYPEAIKLGISDDEVLTYDITEPIYAGVGGSVVDKLVEQLQTITAVGVVAVNATEEEIAKFGLDEPVAVAEYELGEEKHTLRLGTPNAGLYGLMLDDCRTIYTVSAKDVDVWADASIYSLRDGFIRLPYIKSVQKVTVTAKDGTDVYDIERILNEERSTEDTPFYDLAVSKDGSEIAYKHFQPFYQMLLSVALLNEDIREPEGQPILTVRYDYFNGKHEEIAFYADPNEERRCIATLNGQPTGAVRASDITAILEAKPVIAANQPVVEKD